MIHISKFVKVHLSKESKLCFAHLQFLAYILTSLKYHVHSVSKITMQGILFTKKVENRLPILLINES